MGKLYLKNRSIRLPNVIIIEGFWCIGKTKLANKIAKKFNYTFIKEPNHLSYKIKNNISRWYRTKHIKRYENLIELLNKGQLVIMERSFISSMAFDYAKSKKYPSDFQKNLKKIKKLKDFLIIFLYGDKTFIKKKMSKLKDSSVKKQILYNQNFYNNYLNFYRNILPSVIRNKIIFIKVNKKERFKKKYPRFSKRGILQ